MVPVQRPDSLPADIPSFLFANQYSLQYAHIGLRKHHHGYHAARVYAIPFCASYARSGGYESLIRKQ